jgi:hypothetical protein
MNNNVVVFGAYGHTGRFVVAELLARGFVPVLSGRDASRLQALAADAGLEARPASVDDEASLDRALAGAAAVINAAGPFATTAAPVVEAALRAGIPYVDVAAEIEAIADTFTRFAGRADTAIVPAMAFYGGLGDLLATAAMGDWTAADEAHIAYGLSGWHPTAGTRAAGAVSRERRNGQRVRYTNGALSYHDEKPPTLQWTFPAPLGARDVVGEFSMADIVTIPSHLSIPELRSYMTVEAATGVVAADTGAERTAETFLVDVVVSAGGVRCRATASGQDIYAVSRPLAVEAVHRLLTGQSKAVGVTSAGAAFDARDFLDALSPHIRTEIVRNPS